MLHSEILIPNITIGIFEGILYKLANNNHYEISVTQKSAEYHHILVKKDNVDLVELDINTVPENSVEVIIRILESEDRKFHIDTKDIIICEYPGFLDYLFRKVMDIINPSKKLHPYY